MVLILMVVVFLSRVSLWVVKQVNSAPSSSCVASIDVSVCSPSAMTLDSTFSRPSFVHPIIVPCRVFPMARHLISTSVSFGLMVSLLAEGCVLSVYIFGSGNLWMWTSISMV